MIDAWGGACFGMQYLEELMSTRLGVQRQGEVLSADKRTGPDGKEYYDIQARPCSPHRNPPRHPVQRWAAA